jgi:hypothetical protein
MPRKKAQSDAARPQDRTDTPLEEAAGPAIPAAAAEEEAPAAEAEVEAPAAAVKEEAPAVAEEKEPTPKVGEKAPATAVEAEASAEEEEPAAAEEEAPAVVEEKEPTPEVGEEAPVTAVEEEAPSPEVAAEEKEPAAEAEAFPEAGEEAPSPEVEPAVELAEETPAAAVEEEAPSAEAEEEAPTAEAEAAPEAEEEAPPAEAEAAPEAGEDVPPAEAEAVPEAEEETPAEAEAAPEAAEEAPDVEAKAVAGAGAAPVEQGAPLPFGYVAAPSAAPDGVDLQRKKRRRLLFGLGALILLLIAVGAIFGRYLVKPGPLPDLLPLPVDLNYRPHYLFSIYGVKQPGGVALSPDDERIYVTETGGQREVKIFDRDGGFRGSFAPPRTQPGERAPAYVAVDPAGRVLVTDRLQRAVFVYDRDGRLLDAILGPDLTLGAFLSQQVEGAQPDDLLAYNLFEGAVFYQKVGEGERELRAPDPSGWAPLGVRVDGQGAMLLTDVAEGQHTVRRFPGDLILAAPWQEFAPPELVFGAPGQGSDKLLFPNVAVADSRGRIYVTDGNNGRISVWDETGAFLFTFGRGVGEGALSLPRGAAMDGRDRLHIADAVQQAVKVYDVSGPEPSFLYAFGDWGTGDGQFNYPGDIALDGAGRLYIADRENNRIQVWSY